MTFTAASPDFGVFAVVDRFAQIAPRVLFTAESVVYNGKRHALLSKAQEVAGKIPSIETIILIGAGGDGLVTTSFDALIAPFQSQSEIPFEPLPFDHPLIILYSSGTTGKPKCIVHSVGVHLRGAALTDCL